MKIISIATWLLTAIATVAIASPPAARRPVAEVVTPITGDAMDLEVYPKPRQEAYSGQALRLSSVSIEATGLDASPARRLLGELLEAWGMEASDSASSRLVLRLVEAPSTWQPAPDQGYRLTVAAGDPGPSILIEGGGPAGVFYGLQTLRQLVHVKDGVPYVREASIEDWPAIPFRGPASIEAARWKSNLHPIGQAWPPLEPRAWRRQENLQRQNWIINHLKTLAAAAKTASQGDLFDDLDALLNPDMSSDADERMREYSERQIAALKKERIQLREQMVVVDADYEKHKQTVRASSRKHVERLRDHHIEPIIHYQVPHLFAQSDHHADVEQLLDEVFNVYEFGYDIGVRKFSMHFNIFIRYEPQNVSDPTYGELQARIIRDVMAWLKEKNPKNELFLEHQKNAIRIQTIRNHVVGYRLRRDLTELAAEFAAAGIPEDLQIMWMGCGNPVTHITAGHAQTMSDLFGGRRASYLNMQELRGRILIHDLFRHPTGVGNFIGNGVMERHDPELARHLTMANFPGWGNQLWSWNPEGYDRQEVTAGMLREWLRGIGAGPAAYKELAALAQWQMEHGTFAVVGVGWSVEAMLSDDQNRLTPEQVDERMARKRAFYETRLKALRAALPPAGDALYQRIESEALERLTFLDEKIVPALRTRPVGTAVRATGPIRLDGVLDEAAWAEAPEHGNFQGVGFRGDTVDVWAEADLKTTFRVVYDDKHVYIAVRCEEPQMNQVKVSRGTDIRSVVGGDHIQLIIDHTGMKQRGSHLTTTLHGQRIVGNEGKWSPGQTDPGPLLDWQWPRAFEVKTAKAKDGWVAEFAIALKDLDPQYRPAPGRRWGFNVLRRRDILPRPPVSKEPFFDHRYSWQRTSVYHGAGPSYRGQVLFFGALVFE